jgi:site-specific recombinase XerD
MPNPLYAKIAYENNTSHQVMTLAVSPAKVYLDTLAPGSRRAMTAALTRCAGLLRPGQNDPLAFPWHTLTRDDAAALRAALDDGRTAPAMANKLLAAFRGVIRETWRMGLIDAETMTRLVDLKSVPGSSLPAGRALTTAEIRALFHTCADDARPQGTRDAALLGLLLGCGLRRAEVCSLDLADYDATAGALVVRGKRNKQRTAHAPAGTQAALTDWLALRGAAPGPLFYRINRGGRQTAARLSEQAIYEILERRAEAAHVAHLSPHDCRRTFVSNLLDHNVDISTVQRMAGHSNVTTTARYDRRPEEAKRKAAGMLHIPYRSRK